MRNQGRWIVALWGVMIWGTALAAEEAPSKATLRDQIIERIGSAHSSIDVVVYEIGSQEIADALADAKDRGTRIRVVVDEERSFGVSKPERFLLDQGVPVRKVSVHQWKLLHDKFILFDNLVAATPSYNRTDEQNASEDGEVFVTQKALVHQLSGEFHKVWDVAKPAE